MSWLWEHKNSISDSMSIVELNVRMDCNGCKNRVRKAINRLDGVDNVEIDMDAQKVTVTGYVNQRDVLKAVRRTGKRAEFWPFPYESGYHAFAIQYLEEDTYASSQKYYQHGYNSAVHGYFPGPPHSVIVDDDTASMFHEDNVHACVVM